jgi:putative serine protease PepD
MPPASTVNAAAPAGGGVATTPRKGRKTALVVAAAVVLALGAGFGAGVAGAHVGNSASATDSSLNQQTTSPVVSDSQPVATGSVEAVAAKLLPSVVSILSVSSSAEAEGSGVILSSDGLILTNNHVIAGATTLTVKFNDGTTATAKVIGSDATDDLAVIKVSGVSGLAVATLGSSANVKVGEQVVAVGSPLGLSATVTSGIVSALNRPVRTAAEDTQGQQQDQGQGQLGQGQGQLGQGQDPTQTQTSTSQDTVLNAIQTDAAINPGNSGGALVDMNGAVIGINSAIASLSSGSSQSGSIGVGFAIPIDQAHRIAQEIINTGHATHAVLGASVGDAPVGTSATAQAEAQAGLSVGAKIASVTAGGGAAGAGLAAGDVITKVGSTPVGSADALIATIRSSTPGGKVVVTYLRGSDTKTATVTLGSAVSN